MNNEYDYEALIEDTTEKINLYQEDINNCYINIKHTIKQLEKDFPQIDISRKFF